MKIISDSIREICARLEGQYNSSSLQVQLPDDLAQAVIDWGKKNIPDDVLHDNAKETKGREDDIHVTLLYGLPNPGPDEVEGFLKDIGPFKVRLGLVTLFKDKPEYDVIKIDVESSDLYQLHYKIRDSVEVNNSYPSYSPHCTIGYVKKDSCEGLMGSEKFKGKTFEVDAIVFSSSNGDKIPITLKRGV